MSTKIFISMGHGGRDSGAIGNNFLEKDINLDIGLSCANYLANYDTKILLSRTKDEDDSVSQEVIECNYFNPVIAISFHCNSNTGTPADGAEAYCSKESALAKRVGDAILLKIEAMGQNIRSGSKKVVSCKTKIGADGRDYYYFIRECNCPAIIIEVAFINNAKDIQFCDTYEERQKIGIECGKAIAEELGLKQKAKPKKSLDTIAQEVIQGKWGNGTARKVAINKAGYDYTEVQKRVNKLLGLHKNKPEKTNKEIAQEVIKGLWGNGNERIERLTQAGYNYKSIQLIVNELVKK